MEIIVGPVKTLFELMFWVWGFQCIQWAVDFLMHVETTGFVRVRLKMVVNTGAS